MERMRWFSPDGRRLAAGLLAGAGLLAATATVGLCATAAHDPWRLAEVRDGAQPLSDAAGRCDACHTLSPTESEAGTGFISHTARTLQWIKLYKGGKRFTGADQLACTFCHSAMLDNTSMQDALGEFTTTTVKHPMGRKIDGVTDTSNEWLSAADSVEVADELQCTSCHAGALVTYPFHEGRTTDPAPWTGSWDAGVNPDALKNVAAAGDRDKRHCVDTCHGNAVAGGNGPTRPLMGHYAWGGFDGTTLHDPAGQALQVAGSTCAVCHDAHTSTEPGLIQDGLRRGAPDPGRAAIDEASCVAVCHAAGAFNTHGHGGKVGISSTACTPCHDPGIGHRDQTDDATRRRLSYLDPAKSGLTANLGADGRDNDMDGVRDASDPDEQTFAYSKTANCKTCHINYAGHGAGARAASCLDCHDMHGDDAAANDNAAMIRSTLFGENATFSAADRSGGVFYKGAANPDGLCDNDACHANISGSLASAHRGGAAALAQPCDDCHAISHRAAPNTDDSFKVACTGCHGPGGVGPTVVWPSGNAAGRGTRYGSHLGAAAAEEDDAYLGGLGTGWTTQCNKCHTGHSGALKVPAPPASWSDPSGRLSGTDMRGRLGLGDANEPGVALHLGGTAQGGATEAEFCWGCHDANGVSEWGFNTKTTPAGFPVVLFATQHDGSQESEDQGWIYTSTSHATKTSDWTAGYWQSEYDPLNAKRIASVHTASFDPAGQSSSVAANVDANGLVNRTAPALEAKGYIRCSYCHDVHDTFGPGGKPYLRGRWAGDPYPPELPPRTGYAYTTYLNTLTGIRTPRAQSTARDKGGYFIDQNSNWPTNNAALDTVQETAELCTLCHGTNVDTMDFYTGKKLWRAPMVNGHSNSALGGTGAYKVDLFSGLRGDSYNKGMGMQNGQPSTPWVCGSYGDQCDYSYPQLIGCCTCVSDCGNILGSGWYGSDFANWYGTGTIGGASGAGSMAHKFTCSKCHVPHAAGLPALLPQNCIDPAQGNFTVNGFTGVNLLASNCHRKTSKADGWHVLAPGQ
jgi:hypothetical protein